MNDEAVLDFLSRELFGLRYDSLLPEHKEEVLEELRYRDSKGWRA